MENAVTKERPPVIRCFACSGEGSEPARVYGRVVCKTCQGTGSVFWVSGRAFPYSPGGEKLAVASMAQNKMEG